MSVAIASPSIPELTKKNDIVDLTTDEPATVVVYSDGLTSSPKRRNEDSAKDPVSSSVKRTKSSVPMHPEGTYSLFIFHKDHENEFHWLKDSEITVDERKDLNAVNNECEIGMDILNRLTRHFENGETKMERNGRKISDVYNYISCIDY
jgi:hypothetical protein